MVGNTVSQFLKIWVIPDVRQLPRAKIALKDSCHPSVQKWAWPSEGEELDGVRDILPNPRKTLDFLTLTWESTSSSYHLRRQTGEHLCPPSPKTDRLE